MFYEELTYSDCVFTIWEAISSLPQQLYSTSVILQSIDAKKNWVLCLCEGMQGVFCHEFICVVINYYLSLKSLCGLVEGIADGSNFTFAVVEV